MYAAFQQVGETPGAICSLRATVTLAVGRRVASLECHHRGYPAKLRMTDIMVLSRPA